MVVGENKRSNIMDGIENTGDVRLHDHRLRLKQRFDIVRKLGQGTYGKVQLGINKKTGQEVAIKTIKKCKIESEADLVRIRREVQIMSSVRHPNIVHIYEVFENSEKMILVMEYCSGGELYDYLSQKKVLQEDEARRLFRQIATAVYYCHIHKICHRDLKLENVLLDDTGSAKIADFGLSNVFKETSLLSTFCGSPLYASPEIVKGTPYIGPEVDCWSLGVLLYTLVYGAMPFDGSNFKRLVRQISNGDYYEPKNPSSASPLIRDMLTVDPLKRADIAYICDHSWVNFGCETSCLEMSEMLAAETPVRLDLLLSLAPAAPSNCNSVVVPNEAELGTEESGADLTTSASMAVEPSNSAEKRILDLVAEGGEDAIKPSPTRTIVSASDNKRKLELAMSASGMQRKKERVASSASVASPEQPPSPDSARAERPATPEGAIQPNLVSSATMTISPAPAAPAELVKDLTKEIVKEPEEPKTPVKARVAVKKKTPKAEEKSPEKPEAVEEKPTVSAATEKLTALAITPAPAAPKPKKFSIPGGNVGSFKEQFERRASLTAAPEIKRNVSKPVVSKIAKPKAQSEDRELQPASAEGGTVRLQQIGIEPSPAPVEELNRGGVKKTESEPSHSSAVDPSVLLQDARRSLQNSMAKLVEEKVGEENRRRAARDIISTAIRTGKPPVPYGRSSSAGVTSLCSPPGTPPAPPSAPPSASVTAPSSARVFRTEAQHRVEDHRPRGVSVERIIPIQVAEEPGVASPRAPPTAAPATPTTPAAPSTPATPAPAPRAAHTPLRRLTSSDSATSAAESCSSAGEPIKKSAREFIIPIAVEGKGYVTPRQRSLEPDSAAPHRRVRAAKPRRISSLVSGGESEEEDDTHMHRLRSTRAARAESVSSGEEDEEDEGFHLLTAENLFSTLLHRVRALTNRLNGEEGPGFPQHPHSLFNNLQSPFFNSPHLPRRHLLREGWGARDLHADFDSMFNKSRQQMPRGNSKKSGKHQSENRTAEDSTEGLDLSDLDLSSIQLSEREVRALSGLTPALSRRLQRQLLAQLPPAAARQLRRTLSLHAPTAPTAPAASSTTATTATAPRTCARSHSASERAAPSAEPEPEPPVPAARPATPDKTESVGEDGVDVAAPQYSTLPRQRRAGRDAREAHRSVTPPEAETAAPRARGGSSVRSTPDRPLLSKYLTPERAVSLDESYSSDGGSILSEPSYIAAYGAPTLRRHSMRLPADQPKKRVSRFLRPDFFDTPPDESLYAKQKREKELETQKILREIREKKSRALESSLRSPTETIDAPLFREDPGFVRKLSPSVLLKERSRSNTPFFPILDNIKETALDNSNKRSSPPVTESDARKHKTYVDEVLLNKESKLTRPKSFPVKNLERFDESSQTVPTNSFNKETESKEKTLPRESKLIRPKSYPTSSPSPEKVYISRNVTKEESISDIIKEETVPPLDNKTDVEVSFSISLPKKKITVDVPKAEKIDNLNKPNENVTSELKDNNDTSLVLKKYVVVNNKESDEKSDAKEIKVENGQAIANGKLNDTSLKLDSKEEVKLKANTNTSKKEELPSKSTEGESGEKKATIKKKIIKKVSSKSKTDVGSQDSKDAKPVEKKKVTKKVKEKETENGAKVTTVTKKKSVLQSIGHKLEKFTSSKSNSPEKVCENKVVSNEAKKDTAKLSRTQREQSVPVSAEPPTESNLIKRAVTVTDVATLDSQTAAPSKTTVSKVLGLFKKFEPKDKVTKPSQDKSRYEVESNTVLDNKNEPLEETTDDKPKRPTSLLLNGLGRKNKYGKVTNENGTAITNETNDETVLKKETEPKNFKNSLKLDFSRLPRVKKIVPTDPVIEPQIMNVSPIDKSSDKKEVIERNGTISVNDIDTASDNRSRSRSRSTFSNSENKSDHSSETKIQEKNVASDENNVHSPLRNPEPTTPEREDIVERIRRKSFYSRFNEKKQRRKSNLVGPGAVEYDPLAVLHAAPEPALPSPVSPAAYDLSPGYSAASDLSPSTDRYRSLLTETPATRNNLRFDTYGLNDKIDTYRSLDRNEFRKYPGTRSYLDYDQPTSYGTLNHRYSRTKSLLDSGDGEEASLAHLREPQRYNRTISMYSPGNYATYRPKRTRNSAIILKESEKEPSPENILERIRQRKNISISVTRKPDPEKEPLPRSTVSSKGEGDGPECSEKID